MDDDQLRGIDLGNGILLAPHRCSDEEEEINYKPVSPDNYELKIRDIREWCRTLDEEPNRILNAAWVSGHLMCILKYGDGYERYVASPATQEASPRDSLSKWSCIRWPWKRHDPP